MSFDIKLGDRVKVSNGDCATVLKIDGIHIHMRLDNTRHMSATLDSLKKIAKGEEGYNPPA